MSEQNRNGLVIAAVVLLIASGLVPFVMWASVNDFGDAVGALIFTFIFTPILFLVGIVLLIVGLSKGRRQQQQQQVVVMNRSQAQARGLVTSTACPHCGHGLGGGERFCTGCGQRLAHG